MVIRLKKIKANSRTVRFSEFAFFLFVEATNAYHFFPFFKI